MTDSTSSDSLSVDVCDDGTIVVHGDIDMAAGPTLDAALSPRQDSEPIVVDIGGVSFIDSSGLRTLLDASRRARLRGADLVLRSVGPEVSRLLEITGTTEQFQIEGDRD